MASDDDSDVPMTDEELPKEIRESHFAREALFASLGGRRVIEKKDPKPRIWEIKLFRAIRKKDIEFVKGALAKYIFGKDNLIQPLFHLFNNNDTLPEEIWKFLEFSPIDFNYKYISAIGHIAHDEYTLLQYSLVTKRNEIAKLFLQVQFPQIDFKSSYLREAPIVLATNNNLPEIVESLINKDKNLVNTQDLAYKMPILTLAVEKNFVEIVELLLRQPNINVNSQNAVGETSLMFAIFKNFPSLVRMLLNSPYINVHIKDCTGQDALFHAISRHGEENEITKMILEHRENKRQRTN